MAGYFNVVGTRIPSGDREAARRWYGDHVVQLMAFAGLLRAHLYERESPGKAEDGAALAPDFLCFYDFGDAASFAAYEHSPEHQAAAADRAQGWGREGIEIVLRRQYQRHAAFSSDQTAGSAPARCHISAWTQPAPAAPSASTLSTWRRLAALPLLQGCEQLWLLQAADGSGGLQLRAPTSDPPPFPHAWHAAYARVLDCCR
jgi:hypothetical protein